MAGYKRRRNPMVSKVKTYYGKLVIVMLLGGLWACAALLASDKIKPEPSASENGQPSGNELIEGYKQWTRVNPVPAVFHSQIAIQCAAPTAKQTKMEEGNPHRDKFIIVYVNEVGTHAMMKEKNPRFPQGSIIVKEKLSSKDSSSPELLTVMIKREAGYNPLNGDWEYMSLDGVGKEVQARGKLESCQACHMMVKDNDYVSRNYLPYNIWKQLK
jgi:hypothetical protein